LDAYIKEMNETEDDGENGKKRKRKGKQSPVLSESQSKNSLRLKMDAQSGLYDDLNYRVEALEALMDSNTQNLTVSLAKRIMSF
jgi:hypothetical protein